MKEEDRVYLKHILDAISTIEQYVGSSSYDEFLGNRLLQDGVIRQIQIIGEASKKLSSELKQKYPQIPWKDIVGMRDKIVHDYLGVDPEVVWKTISGNIPEFKKEVSLLMEMES
ncbi:hypothetical protein COT30_00890 [Candidatus Micrarchaeota archaeon CG08_land_8_20_14_0_20_49_17]|nr:MAG: hypothetical protein COT30_00890 [Candidatus Micrarchaeota archaeon CG08_land_8_20_14_0_20_49_17]PIU81798.1 MAG: hypothetical protein COS70_02455 [Candidatus Micrarchaeota archaeon CG06_land_8_20_14_3_00_50_6]PIZ93574.1 MAG: hypothetical protein COX84_05900 [Candidatus Micrarchaeota archaeon CG_4_10_14_0_2_um_filter_49_7]